MLDFATLEADLATTVVGTFANVYLVRASDSVAFTAVLDRAVERVGEYGQVIDRRDQLTVQTVDGLTLAGGDTLAADPDEYTPDALAALPRSAWVLDGLASDDGYVQTWYTR